VIGQKQARNSQIIEALALRGCSSLLLRSPCSLSVHAPLTPNKLIKTGLARPSPFFLFLLGFFVLLIDFYYRVSSIP
jgi:hypothetical protein